MNGRNDRRQFLRTVTGAAAFGVSASRRVSDVSTG